MWLPSQDVHWSMGPDEAARESHWVLQEGCGYRLGSSVNTDRGGAGRACAIFLSGGAKFLIEEIAPMRSLVREVEESIFVYRQLSL